MRYLLLAILAACAPLAPVRAQAFNPLAFFTGPTRGEGTLRILIRPVVPIRIQSVGRPDGRGGMVLEQTINEGSKPPRERRWVLRPTSATTLIGTITDTPGPIRGRLAGNQLFLNYAMKGGMRAEQTLTFQPGSGTVINRMRVKRFGIVVARVEETIRKLD